MQPGQGRARDFGPPRVVFEDNHLLALAKPAGQPCVPDESGDPSLLESGKLYLKARYAKPGEVFLGVVHRLDRPVSGLVLFARTSKAAARLSEQWRQHAVQKRYLAIGAGSRVPESRLFTQYLRKDSEARRVEVFRAPAPGALEARTELRAWQLDPGRIAFQLEPQTGRPHQLRALCASLGAPLLGDLKYGAREALPDRSIALHALRLVFEHPTQRQPLELSAPVPEQPWWAGFAGATAPHWP
jgi:23S rRNA pseudouridine1911/1915/1917 synthase